MFTGIIETLGIITAIEREEHNLTFSVRSSISAELKIDQSVSHNGVCITVIEVQGDIHKVTAIDETIQKTNFKNLNIGDAINLERCLKIGDRLDGHMVQGHIDQTAICTNWEDAGGSWLFSFDYDPAEKNITVEKGSIAVNGVSLTVVNSERNSFTVAIIPYTYEHTVFKNIKKGDVVNLEFDIIGKYISRLVEFNSPSG